MTRITHANEIILLAELEKKQFRDCLLFPAAKVETCEILFVPSASEGEPESTQPFRSRGPERVAVNLVKKKKKVEKERNKRERKKSKRISMRGETGRIIVHVNGIIETTCAPYVSPFIYHLPQFSSAPR